MKIIISKIWQYENSISLTKIQTQYITLKFFFDYLKIEFLNLKDYA